MELKFREIAARALANAQCTSDLQPSDAVRAFKQLQM